LSAAIAQTNPAGEVVVLDSAGYGPFHINQAISVIAPPGVYAGVSVFSGDGVDIFADPSSDVVVLRGLTLNSQGGNGLGVFFGTGALLHIESCVVNGFANDGIRSSGAGTLEVKDSIIRGNFAGIEISHFVGSTAFATIEHTLFERNATVGLFARDGTKVTVRNSVASANADVGFQADAVTFAPAELNIENCVITNNGGAGVSAHSSSTPVARARISNSTITNNGFGLANGPSPAVILSRGNNTVEGNGTNTTGTISTYTAK
jgi:hypothetical protein